MNRALRQNSGMLEFDLHSCSGDGDQLVVGCDLARDGSGRSAMWASSRAARLLAFLFFREPLPDAWGEGFLRGPRPSRAQHRQPGEKRLTCAVPSATPGHQALGVLVIIRRPRPSKLGHAQGVRLL